MDEKGYLGSVDLKRFLIKNLAIGFVISVSLHFVGGPSVYYAWASLFDSELERAPETKTIALKLSPKIVPPKPPPRDPVPSRASGGLRGARGGGAPGQIAKPSMTMRMQPVTALDLEIADQQAVNREPTPSNPVPDFPGIFAKPVASLEDNLVLHENQPGYGGGALPGPKTYGGPDVADASPVATRGVPGGPPGTDVKGRFGDELGEIGSGRGGSGPPSGSGIGGPGEGSGTGTYGIGRGSGPEGFGRASEGEYSSSVGSGGNGTGGTGIVEAPPPVTKEELEGLMAWLRQQNVTFSPVVQSYLGTSASDLCGITSYSGWNIFVQFSEIKHQLKIFLTRGENGILLADSDFRQRSQYFASGNVTRADNEISAIQAVRDKPSTQRTEEFYRVFGNWMTAQGISLQDRASR